MTFRNANVPHAVLISWPAQTQTSPKISQRLQVQGIGCALCISSEQEVFKQEGFLFFSYFSHTQQEFKFDFMLRFMIQKRSEVICIFWHFKQFTAAQKRILKTCLKSATAVLKETNGRNQPGYSIVLLILHCQMERTALDNEEQWVFPSLSCPPATGLLNRALLLICYFNVLLTKTVGQGEREEDNLVIVDTEHHPHLHTVTSLLS